MTFCKINDVLKVNTKSVCLQSRFAVKWLLNTDRVFKSAVLSLKFKSNVSTTSKATADKTTAKAVGKNSSF